MGGGHRASGRSTRRRRGRRSACSTGAAALATVGVDARRRCPTSSSPTSTTTTSVASTSFPAARFHVQDREVAYATGRHMTRPALQPRLHRGPRRSTWCARCTTAGWSSTPATTQLAPGLSVHLVGGHTRRAAGRAGRDERRAGWCWRRTPPTTTRTSRPGARSPSCSTSERDGGGLHTTLARLASTTGRRHPGPRSAGARPLPPPSPGLEGIAVRLDQGRVARR